MSRVLRLLVMLLAVGPAAVACGSAGELAAVEIAVDANGFPLDWPIAVLAGTVNDCDNGEVSQEDGLFSVVVCLPNDPDPFTVAEKYLATLERDGFLEREPGAFITEQQTFLHGNGIEIFFQLINDEATVVLIRPSS